MPFESLEDNVSRAEVVSASIEEKSELLLELAEQLLAGIATTATTKL